MLDSIVTFRKADATIKIDTFEADPAGDIWFQFKTTATDGVLLHNIGDPDYIKVALFSEYLNRNTVESHHVKICFIQNLLKKNSCNFLKFRFKFNEFHFSESFHSNYHKQI